MSIFESFVNPHFLNEFLIILFRISLRIKSNHSNTSARPGTVILPLPSIRSYSASYQSWYNSTNPTLNGLIMPTSQGWHTDVNPPGVWITLVPAHSTASNKSGWTWVSILSNNTAEIEFLWIYGSHIFYIHNCMTRLSIHSSACLHPCMPDGMICGRLVAIGPLTASLNTTNSGNLLPSDATVMHTVHRLLQLLPRRTDTVFTAFGLTV